MVCYKYLNSQGVETMKNSKKFLRTLGCLLLIVSMALCTACKPASPQNPAVPSTQPTQAVVPAGFDKPILRFAVTSDVHIREASNNFESRERLASFISTAYAYSDAQTDYNKLDAMFFIGDITNGGTKEQQTDFFNYVKAHTRPETVARAVIGNHEFYATGHYTSKSFEEAPKKFLEYSGYETMDVHLEIGGYHFLLMAMDHYDAKTYTYFGATTKLAWLRKELDAIVAQDPTKPIFVFQHEPPKGTVVGSAGGNGDIALYYTLTSYPQVIDFSGHSHRPLSDMRSIWQGKFTALGTGSLAYLSCTLPDHTTYKNGGIQAADTEGGMMTDEQKSLRNGYMYYIVEVDQYHHVRVLIYDMYSEKVWGEPYIIDSLDPNNFKYTNDRKNATDKPVYATGAALSVLASTATTADISIPQATSKDVVQSYRVEVYQGDQLVDTVYRLACTFMGASTPATVKAPLTNLQPGTTYTVKVIAVNSWAAESDPLTLEFTTSAS